MIAESAALWFKLDAKSIMAGGTTTTEREFTKWAIGLAEECGFLVHHNRNSRQAQPGLPDLVLLRPPELLFVELKRLGRGASLRVEQQQWIDGLQRCGQEAEVWTPSDIPGIWTRLTGTPWD